MELEQFFGMNDVDLSGSEFSIWGVVTYVIHSL
jgi:hypothetical protein